MIDRIRKLMEYKALSPSQFADGVEVPRAVISHILSERNKPSLEVVQKILTVHQDISVNWLLLGKGDMLTTLAEGKPNDESINPAAFPPEKAPEQPGAGSGEIEKVQYKAQDSELEPRAPVAGKSVEQVIIFYSDKSFITYSPAQ